MRTEGTLSTYKGILDKTRTDHDPQTVTGPIHNNKGQLPTSPEDFSQKTNTVPDSPGQAAR